jgi:lipoprotein signal peptidase
MTVLATVTIVILFVDQAIKHVVLTRLSEGSVSLGVLGNVRPIRRPIWLMRARRQPPLAMLWTIWTAAAAAALAVAAIVPPLDWPLGLLLGGALSHAIETTWRGSVCDYVCLRFWPAFNAADVALTLGGLGVALEVIGGLR